MWHKFEEDLTKLSRAIGTSDGHADGQTNTQVIIYICPMPWIALNRQLLLYSFLSLANILSVTEWLILFSFPSVSSKDYIQNTSHAFKTKITKLHRSSLFYIIITHHCLSLVIQLSIRTVCHNGGQQEALLLQRNRATRYDSW